MIDLYFCHRSKFLEIATVIGYECGVRSDKLHETCDFREGGGKITFVDNNFKDPDVDRLLSVVEEVQPDLAVLPDVYEKDEFDEILSVGAETEERDVTPIVVPKTEINFDDIPDEWRLGYSVDADYGSTELSMDEFEGEQVHLLGGTPNSQFAAADKAVQEGAIIVSADGNGMTTGCNYGRIMNDPAVFLDGGNGWRGHEDYETVADAYDWSGRVVVSLVNYYETWRRWCMKNEEFIAF
jgi:hypothetical protein